MICIISELMVDDYCLVSTVQKWVSKVRQETWCPDSVEPTDNLQVKTEEEVKHCDASMCPVGFSSWRESVCSNISYSVTLALKIKPNTEILKLDLKETTQYSVSFAFWFFQMEGVLISSIPAVPQLIIPPTNLHGTLSRPWLILQTALVLWSKRMVAHLESGRFEVCGSSKEAVSSERCIVCVLVQDWWLWW